MGPLGLVESKPSCFAEASQAWCPAAETPKPFNMSAFKKSPITLNPKP